MHKKCLSNSVRNYFPLIFINANDDQIMLSIFLSEPPLFIVQEVFLTLHLMESKTEIPIFLHLPYLCSHRDICILTVQQI
jgi:hypothetical protein